MLSSVFTSALSRGDRGILSPDLPHTGTRHTRFPDSQSCLCLSPPPHRTHDLRQLCGCASLPWCIPPLRISKRREKSPSENRGGFFIQTYFTANRQHSAFCFTAQGNGAYLSSSLRMRIGINSPSPAPQSSVRACGHGIERPHPQSTWRPACSPARRPGT